MSPAPAFTVRSPGPVYPPPHVNYGQAKKDLRFHIPFELMGSCYTVLDRYQVRAPPAS